ncbi:hypothetical protein ANRL3_02864 [Anaerolineae bacterium]|nr:hypothetical protein ANRL3_02864 [Anaerolineae bacterium]
MDIETIRRLVREGNYYFYAHALTEAKKDGVTPEDAVQIILTGEIIEEYLERHRVLVHGTMTNKIPLHVVCDYSNDELVLIPTVYIPSRRRWAFSQRRKTKGEK